MRRKTRDRARDVEKAIAGEDVCEYCKFHDRPESGSVRRYRLVTRQFGYPVRERNLCQGCASDLNGPLGAARAIPL